MSRALRDNHYESSSGTGRWDVPCVPFAPPHQADDAPGNAMRLIHLCLPLVPLVLLVGCATPRVDTNNLPVFCLDTPKAGNCAGRTPGFYYDYPSDTCRAFSYGPCHGPMPFTSRELCDQACVARGK